MLFDAFYFAVHAVCFVPFALTLNNCYKYFLKKLFYIFLVVSDVVSSSHSFLFVFDLRKERDFDLEMVFLFFFEGGSLKK